MRCPRCDEEMPSDSRFYGPCESCRAELRRVMVQDPCPLGPHKWPEGDDCPECAGSGFWGGPPMRKVLP